LTSGGGWIGILLVLAVLALWMVRRQTAHPAADPDLAVLEQLRKAGSDLTKPHSPEFFLYLPAEAPAREAARRLEAEGYAVKVEPGAQGSGQWLCRATRSLVPRHATLAAIRVRLRALAAELGGEYDGWGTPVVK
jgi:regulator of ribonuclease activity B